MKTYNSFIGFEATEHIEVGNASANDIHAEEMGTDAYSYEDFDRFFPDAAF